MMSFILAIFLIDLSIDNVKTNFMLVTVVVLGFY